MPTNFQINKARKDKKDEFYTPLELIEQESPAYHHLLENKTIYCNCDNPLKSNFAKYFQDNFDNLKLSKLIVTGLPGIKYVKSGSEEYYEQMVGDGDFRSSECIELLKESDVVITNPPFSLFRDYLKMLVYYEKKFLIIGNINAMTCNDIAPLVRNHKMWLGHSIHSGDRTFYVPDGYPMEANTCGDENGNRFIKVKGVRWWTNLDHGRYPEKLNLTKPYNPQEYPKFDFYDVINVNKTSDMPCDYFEPMGVPITFLDKHNPDQFEILDANDYVVDNKVPKRPHGLIKSNDGVIDGKPTYVRLVIRRKS